jgi:hypothetical protein
MESKAQKGEAQKQQLSNRISAFLYLPRKSDPFYKTFLSLK